MGVTRDVFLSAQIAPAARLRLVQFWELEKHH